MGKWKEVTIGEVATVKSSKRIFKSDYVSEGIPFYRSKEVGELHDTNETKSELLISREKYEEIKNRFGIPKKGDLLLTSVGTIGKTWIVDEREFYYKDGNLTQIIVNDNLSVEFLKYFFKSPLFIDIVFDKVNGTAYNALTIIKIRNLKLPLPPLPEQQRIVAKLDGLFANIDQAIALLQENIQHTQALMGSVLDEEFGKLNNKSNLIKDLILKTKTLSPKTVYANDEFTYIDISSVNREVFQIESPKILKGNDAPSRARKVVEKGDIVFATTRPNLKNIAIISEDYKNPIASTGFCLLRTNNKLLNNEYLFYFLISEKVQEYIQPFIKGAQYPAISDKDLLSINIPTLSIKEQNKTVNRIKRVFDLSYKIVEIQTKKLDILKSLKSSLLDQAFKGEL